MGIIGEENGWESGGTVVLWRKDFFFLFWQIARLEAWSEEVGLFQNTRTHTNKHIRVITDDLSQWKVIVFQGLIVNSH